MSELGRRIVAHATYEDVPTMIAICKSHLVSNKSEDEKNDMGSGGFLIKKLTPKDLKEMIDDQENFRTIVLKNGDEVLGYLIACDIKKTEISFQRKISELKISGKTFYYKQIAKKIGEKNVGKQLAEDMFGWLKEKKYELVICKIAHQPFRNFTSISFHKKLGFKEIGSIKNDKITLGIYSKIL